MAKSISIFSYPVVLIQSGGELMWVCPDFGLYRAVNLPEGRRIGTATAAQIGMAWLKLMRALYNEIGKKQRAGKVLPHPSTTSALFDLKIRSEKTYSPEEAAPLVGFSVNTVRRALDSSLVHCTVSPGGHRRMTESQIIELRRILLLEPNARREFVDRDIEGVEEVGQS